jgi:transposase
MREAIVRMILGIDISKLSMDVTLLKGEAGNWQRLHKRFANNEQGIQQLLAWLVSQEVVGLQVCMEATNVYWEKVAEALHQADYGVSVVNPRRIKGFAMSQMQRNKTDKVDSEVIAAYCAALNPQAWEAPSEMQRKLRALERHRLDLKRSITQHKNRLESLSDEDVRASVQRVLDALQAERKGVEQQMDELTNQQQEFREQKQLLLSIPGIGPKSANMLLAEIPNLGDYENARAAAADVGVTLAHHESGTSVKRKTKISKLGKAVVRGELHMPALNAMRTNPILRTFAERLRAQARPEPVIICAVVRKLIHICFGVLKHKKPFDPNYGLAVSTA